MLRRFIEMRKKINTVKVTKDIMKSDLRLKKLELRENKCNAIKRDKTNNEMCKY